MLTSSNISSSATKFSDFKQIVGKREFLWANHYTKIFCFCVHSGAPDLIYPGTSLYEHILWMHLEKNRTYARTFPVQRKEINVVKVRFTMMYFSRKLNNKKIIATACNLWRQITCSFQVYHTGLWPHKPPWFPGAKSTRKTPWKTLFWISRFFFTWPTLTSQAVFADNFSDRSTKTRAKKKQFLIANISEILASIELKPHSMCIWFTWNTFH